MSTDYSIAILIDALGQALMRGLNMLTKLPTSAIAYSSNLSLVRMDSGLDGIIARRGSSHDNIQVKRSLQTFLVRPGRSLGFGAVEPCA
ncbi:hypothetical protein F2Q69_00028821 [Brassica cretica]|uniref:Uncharacterized protein n=1 Tax=Brassica cretica TaxID=69181 RepID=A0A8S9RUY4_BRACR|nr:hypothetical protein F2Q69_00028821 [Brassica cretica]